MDKKKNITNKSNSGSPLESIRPLTEVRGQYNFDEIIDRHHTDAVKTDRCKAIFGSEDVIPLWVADMDFRTPDFIFEAIQHRLEHPILGYTIAPNNFSATVAKWIKDHHNWQPEPSAIGFLPGIVPGLAFAVQSLTQPGDGVLVQPPVYFPFFHVVENNHRKLIYNQLVEKDGRLAFDMEDFEGKITSETKLFILCNPHNPGGRVWTRTELERIAAICEKHQLTVVSDEIHADMVLPGNTKHTPFASVSDWAAENTVTFMAPSKVFNMPGLISSSYIIPGAGLRKKFTTFLHASELMSGNIFSYVATLACYEKGESWRVQMLDYVQKNVEYVADYLENNLPQIRPMIPEASFLVWLDCTGLGMENDDELHRFFSLEAGLGLNKGSIFGPGGENHVRMNVATPRAVLEQAMKQLSTAVSSKQTSKSLKNL